MELNKIYLGDAYELIKQIPDNSIDLIITSPPYNLGNNHHTGNKRFNPYDDDLPENEYQIMQVNMLNECFRILKPNGSMFYNHKNRIRDGIQITPYEWILKTKLTIKQELVWFNRSQNFDKIRFYPMTERIYWLSKGKETLFENKINHHDLFTGNDWNAEGTNKAHKRSFPLKFPLDIISCFPNSEIIFDPYSGSGTTCLAAKELGKKFIGIEINEEYHKLSIERLNGIDTNGQTSIFTDFGEIK